MARVDRPGAGHLAHLSHQARPPNGPSIPPGTRTGNESAKPLTRAFDGLNIQAFRGTNLQVDANLRCDGLPIFLFLYVLEPVALQKQFQSLKIIGEFMLLRLAKHDVYKLHSCVVLELEML